MFKGFINKLAETLTGYGKIEAVRKLMLERGFYLYNQYRRLRLLIDGLREISIKYNRLQIKMLVPKPISNEYECKHGRGYEPGVAKILIDNLSSGKIFYDVGAGYGIFSILAAKLTGTPENIHAFEPNPYAYAVLEKNNNLYFNGKMNLIRKFVSDRNAKNMLTLDHYSEKAMCEPHIVKMDIEGEEIRAINGMTRLLKNVHPTLLIEIHPQFIKELYGNPKLVKTMIEKLRRFGYNIEINLSYDQECSMWQRIEQVNFLNYMRNFYIFAY